jgi:diacylglycerol kinase family enzyme
VSVALLYNPISGSGRAHATAARMREGLERAGHRVAMIPTERGAPSEWLRPALERGARGSIELGSIEAGSIEAGPIEAVVVAGGDGAVRLAAGECARAAIPLWHAPCGTENLFARSFGMRSDPAAVASALVARRTRAIDLGHADGQPFVLMASFGFDADVGGPGGPSAIFLGLFPLSFTFKWSEFDRGLFASGPQTCFFCKSTHVTGHGIVPSHD